MHRPIDAMSVKGWENPSIIPIVWPLSTLNMIRTLPQNPLKSPNILQTHHKIFKNSHSILVKFHKSHFKSTLKTHHSIHPHLQPGSNGFQPFTPWTCRTTRTVDAHGLWLGIPKKHSQGDAVKGGSFWKGAIYIYIVYI